MNRKRLLYTTLGAALSLALVACGSGQKSSGSSSQAPSGSSSAGGLAQATAAPAGGQQASAAKPSIRRGGSLNLAIAADAKNFDPMVANDKYSNYVVSNVFEGLVFYNKDIKPVGDLADSWDLSADGLTYTFHLHPGVKFQDGSDFNAAAMKFSMDRVRNNKASPGYADCGPSTVADTTAVDDNTFAVVLTKPFAPFLTKLTVTSHCGVAVSPAAVQKLGDDKFGLNPVGTGPFKFGEWQQGDHVTVAKNDAYWRMGADGKPLPYLDRVNWRLIQSDGERLQGLLTGDIDIGLETVDKDIPTVKANQDLVFQQQAGFAWSGFLVNTAKAPFNNKQLAQALQFAINRDDIISTIFKGLREKQENGVIPPPLGWAVDPTYKPYTYDPAKAKALLAQAGQPNGYSFTIIADTSSQQQADMLQLIQSQLKQVGITMNIESGDFNSVVVKRAVAGDFEAAALTTGGGLDPDSWTFGAFHTGAPFNVMKISDPQIDQLSEQGRAESDLNKRGAIYQQVDKLIMDYAPWVIVANNPDRFVGNKKVQGWHVGQWATSGFAEYWKTSD